MSRIGVLQPPHAGVLYPFTEETPLGESILDAYVCFQDDTRDFVLPFRLSVVLLSSLPYLQIHDANNVLVFSAAFASAASVPWGSDRRVYEWYGQHVVRLTVRLPDPPAGTGWLDPRTCNRMPRRVRSVRVGTTTLSGRIILQAGYNVDLEVQEGSEDALRHQNRLVLSARPNAGLGRPDPCQAVVPVVRRINRILPDEHGNFRIEADDCLRLARPLLYDTSASVPSAAPYAPPLTAIQARSAWRLEDDCPPCCDCDDFVRVYKGLRRVWQRWQDTAEYVEEVRDKYAANRARWLQQRDCRQNRVLDAVLAAEPECNMFLGASWCNTTECCITDAELRFTLMRYRNNAPFHDSTLRLAVRRVLALHGKAQRRSAYAADVYHSNPNYPPVVVLRFPSLSPRDVALVESRLCMTCQRDDSVRAYVSAHATAPLPNPATGAICSLPSPTVPPEVQQAWTAQNVPVKPVRYLTLRTTALNEQRLQYGCRCEET